MEEKIEEPEERFKELEKKNRGLEEKNGELKEKAQSKRREDQKAAQKIAKAQNPPFSSKCRGSTKSKFPVLVERKGGARGLPGRRPTLSKCLWLGAKLS